MRLIHEALLIVILIGVLPSAVSLDTRDASTVLPDSNWKDKVDTPKALVSYPINRNTGDKPVDTQTGTSSGDDESSETNKSVQHLDFLKLPASQQERSERGFHLEQVDDETMRFEAYMGMQPTTGHAVTITEVAKHGDRINISVIFQHPGPETPVLVTPTYPADAIEFSAPPGEYTVSVQLEELNSTRIRVE